MVEVSIIIPIYNAENYLRRCLDTVVNQTFKNLEIILINDGSTDSSLKIMNEYKENYNNIEIINQQNAGQGEARNKGISIAKGNYITFADADDWLSENYVEALYNAIEKNNADISVCNMIMVMSRTFKEIKSIKFPKNELNGDEAVRNLLEDKELKSYPWAKLYKKSIFIENNITFPARMFYEDLAIIFQAFYYSSKISLVNEYCYYYFQSEESSTRAPNPKTIYDRIKALDMVQKFLVDNNSMDKYKYEFYHFCFFHLYIACRKINLWNLNITYDEIVNTILKLINKDSINRKLLDKTLLNAKQKRELLLLKNPKIYDLYIFSTRVISKIKSMTVK
jgi:glycosyltransferase involved in cell wall biosynthesis